MDRLDKNFNNIDPITLRPFSCGYPDGVWIMAIFYSLPIVIPVLVIVFSVFFGLILGSMSWALLGSLLGMLLLNGLLCLPVIVFLFRRSIKALWCSLVYFVILLIALLLVYIFTPNVMLGLLVITVCQGGICYYLYGLKKQSLLT